MSLFCLFFLIGIGNGEFYIFENVRYSSTRTWKSTKTKDRCHVIIKWGHVEPHTVFPLFATCRTELYTARCQFVFSEIDVMHCQWAHFTLYQLSWWRISNWPVFPKLNFPSWRLSRTSCLYSAGVTKQPPACVWQPQSIPTSFIQILQTLGVDRLGNQCPQA